MKTLLAKINKMQIELKAPKGQRNTFANYNFRSAEDILEAVKAIIPLGLLITVTDKLENIGDRYYIKSTVTITDGENSVKTDAYAREPLAKKGFDESQITGASSSYARKYALNGMFLIDDTKDADTQDNSKVGTEKKTSVVDLMAKIKEAKTKAKLDEWLMYIDQCTLTIAQKDVLTKTLAEQAKLIK